MAILADCCRSLATQNEPQLHPSRRSSPNRGGPGEIWALLAGIRQRCAATRKAAPPPAFTAALASLPVPGRRPGSGPFVTKSDLIVDSLSGTERRQPLPRCA